MDPKADDAPSPSRRRGADPAREGLPEPDAVTGEAEFRSPSGKLYRILKTRERDGYDAPE